jgi:alpha 1,2-mannosyltransferase
MESPQRKPDDSCIRLWLGGEEWLGKKKGWDKQAEIVLGGDGFGGYVREGL